MQKWAAILTKLAIAAGVMGFAGLPLIDVGKVATALFCLFLVVFVAVLLIGLVGGDQLESERLDRFRP